jgi:hypothetical protein
MKKAARDGKSQLLVMKDQYRINYQPGVEKESQKENPGQQRSVFVFHIG